MSIYLNNKKNAQCIKRKACSFEKKMHFLDEYKMKLKNVFIMIAILLQLFCSNINLVKTELRS